MVIVTQQKLTDTVPDLLYGEIKMNKGKTPQKRGGSIKMQLIKIRHL